MFNLLSSHRYNDDLIKYYSLWLAYNICQKLLNKSLLNNIRAIHLFNSNQWEMTRYLYLLEKIFFFNFLVLYLSNLDFY